MYTHILVPTDGSPLSVKAVKEAVGLAQHLKARVTVVHVTEPWMPPMSAEGATISRMDELESIHAEAMAARAKKSLQKAATAARTAKVACNVRQVIDSRPWEGITRAAAKEKCDLIVMASHGRSGIAGLLLGSETAKVIAHAKTPVLVCR